MKNNYNHIAVFYDSLCKIIFGNHILNSQITLLKYLPKEGKALFIGGGSGATLKELVKLRPLLNIDYIDVSPKMVEKSRKKIANTSNKVNFIIGTHNSIPSDDYDAILTFFFLDLFELKNRNSVFELLNSKLKKDGKWVIADFNTPQNWHQKLIEMLMFGFLKLSTNIESKKIEDYKQLFKTPDFKEIWSNHFFHGFIFSSSYFKQDGIVVV